MAVNFGQQISAGLESAIGQANRGTQQGLQARRLNQQIEQFQWKKQMDQLVNKVRQKQFQVDQETRLEQLAQQHIENELAREEMDLAQTQEERIADNQESMQEYRQARIQQMRSDGGNEDDGEIGGAQYSNLQTINSRLNKLNQEKQETVQDLVEANTQGNQYGEIDPSVSRGLTERVNYINQQLEQLEQQKAGIMGGGQTQPQQTTTTGNQNQTTTINSREEFDNLPEGEEFIFDGTRYVKQNNQLVPIQ